MLAVQQGPAGVKLGRNDPEQHFGTFDPKKQFLAVCL